MSPYRTLPQGPEPFHRSGPTRLLRRGSVKVLVWWHGHFIGPKCIGCGVALMPKRVSSTQLHWFGRWGACTHWPKCTSKGSPHQTPPLPV